LKVDYHTHHYRCGHAKGKLEEYVEAAIAAGFSEIGLSDHSPIYHLGDDPQPRPQTAMSRLELPNYIQAIIDVREKYKDRINVKLGVESDYILDYDEHYRTLWASYPLDYAIGSIHWLDEWSIFERRLPKGSSVDEVYNTYLHWTQRAAKSGAYDIIGHLDCIKTRGWMPTPAITPLLDETVRVIAESDVAIELNVSGWRKPIADSYPRKELLERCQHYGVPVTYGSDADETSQVGLFWNEAVKLLREVGYREIASFTARKRTMLPLEEV